MVPIVGGGAGRKTMQNQDIHVWQGRAERQPFVGMGDAKSRAPLLRKCARHRKGAESVTISLDHCGKAGWRRQFAERAPVGDDRVEVNGQQRIGKLERHERHQSITGALDQGGDLRSA